MKNSKIKTISTILFLGGLWGLLEATLGTILHLDIFAMLLYVNTKLGIPKTRQKSEKFVSISQLYHRFQYQITQEFRFNFLFIKFSV